MGEVLRVAARAAWTAAVGAGNDPFVLLEMIPWLYLTGEPQRVPVMAAKLRVSGFRYIAMPAADWDVVATDFEDLAAKLNT